MFLKGSYWLSKSSQILKKSWVGEGVKKDTATILIFAGLKRIAKVTHRVDYTCYSFQTRKLKIVALSFFSTPLIFGDGPKISMSVDFEQQSPELSQGPVPEFNKKRRFCQFSCPCQKNSMKIVGASHLRSQVIQNWRHKPPPPQTSKVSGPQI